MENLSKITIDTELVKNVQLNADNQSMIELIERHSKLSHSICNKFHVNFVNSGLCPEEITQNIETIIFKSAINYDETKGMKFSTYLAENTKFACLDHFKNYKPLLLAPNDLNEVIDNGANYEVKVLGVLDDAFEILEELDDKRVAQVYKLRYSEKENTWKQISAKMNLCVPTVKSLHEKGKKILRARLKQDIEEENS